MGGGVVEGRGGRAYCRVQNLGLGLRRDVAASPTYRKFSPISRSVHTQRTKGICTREGE